MCGEETALLASIEGKRGQPVPRPPYPPESGLWGHPTLINNVETFANIPTIIENGGDWFASIGAPASPGTKVFALAGRVVRTGLVEVPIGTSLRTILFDLGGGVPPGLRIQSGPDRRSRRRLHSGAISGSPDGLRLAHAHRHDDGLRRIDRHGHVLLHGGYRALLHGILHGRILREMHSLPRRNGADARHPGAHDAGRSRRRAILRMLEQLCGLLKETSLCGLGSGRSEPGAQHAAPFPRRI